MKPHPNILNLCLLFILGDGDPSQLSILEVVTGGVCQGLDEHLRLVLGQAGVELTSTYLASLTCVLVDQVALVIVLVGVASDGQSWGQGY